VSSIHPDLARCRRDFYGLLSSAYLHIPEKNRLEWKWEPAVELLRYPQEGKEDSLQQIDKALKLIQSYASKENPVDATILMRLAKDWTHLFRGTERNGLLPPYESFYRPGKVPRKPAQEVHRLFSERGIRVPDEWHHPPDYIGVELDFMRLLCDKELHPGERQHALEMEWAFLQEHLGLWVPLFCEKMVQQAREDFFRGIARLTLGLLGYDRQYLKDKLSSSGVQ
jgi:putative dimethyl sulfoxide reductase chaperone